MPVEIKELIIRATIAEGSPTTSSKNKGFNPEEKAEIIAACTDQVLKILARKQER